MGYAIAIVVTVVVLLFVNVWPTWRIFPFLTEGMSAVLWTFNYSWATAIALNVVLLIVDRPWLVIARDLVAAVWGIVVFSSLWLEFPFHFGPTPLDWVLFARFFLVVCLLGCGIGVIVQTVRLIRSQPGADSA